MSETFSVQDCQDTILYCGGRDNIVSAECCTTRVRIVLKDMSLIILEKLNNLPLVQGVWIRSKEVQLVIGIEAIRIAVMIKDELKRA